MWELNNKDGFYMLVLAVDLQQAKVHIQEEFNASYPGTIDVNQDAVWIAEVKPPFPEGKVLCSFCYPNRPQPKLPGE